MKPARAWNPWQLNELRRRWVAGETASTISKAIGKSRDAVIGMSRRRGLPRRPSPILRLRPVGPAQVPPLRARRICQWIEGEPTPDDSCKCGMKPLPDSPYCPLHQKKSVIRRKRLPRLSPVYNVFSTGTR